MLYNVTDTSITELWYNPFDIYFGRVAELVDALDSKSCESNLVRVQVPPCPPI